MIADLIRELVQGYEPNDPEEINGGYCADFSELLVDTLRKRHGVVAISVDSGDVAVNLRHGRGEHVWTYFEGRHYDSEAPEGVEDWLELPFFKRNYVNRKKPRHRDRLKKEAERLEITVAAMKHCWASLDAYLSSKGLTP